LISGKTTFMIAHRLSTLEGCDLRLELEAGGIVNSQVVGPEHRGSAAWHAAAPDRR
jgi:ABC-type bacteriocin/lantibiotic exporter with double-glycine peptidase domain